MEKKAKRLSADELERLTPILIEFKNLKRGNLHETLNLLESFLLVALGGTREEVQKIPWLEQMELCVKTIELNSDEIAGLLGFPPRPFFPGEIKPSWN